MGNERLGVALSKSGCLCRPVVLPEATSTACKYGGGLLRPSLASAGGAGILVTVPSVALDERTSVPSSLTCLAELLK